MRSLDATSIQDYEYKMCMVISVPLDRGCVILEKENGLNTCWLKHLIFANFIKTYDHGKTLLGTLKGSYKVLGSVRGPRL